MVKPNQTPSISQTAPAELIKPNQPKGINWSCGERSIGVWFRRVAGNRRPYRSISSPLVRALLKGRIRHRGWAWSYGFCFF